MPLACTLLGLLSFQNAAAPVAAPSDEARSSVIGTSFGAFEVDGETGAAGPGYAARFRADVVEFVPALGKSAPRSFPVSFALESVRRGDRAIFEAPPPVAPVRDGNFVRYAREGGIVESYEARVDGVEQTFRFESLPEGSGDLIVRGVLTTELPVSTDGEGAEGIRFETPSLGGVTWGAVTGIDANGSTAKGRLRVEGNVLEMSLPGEFVDRAAFPLLLDPLVGPVLVVSAGADDDYSPDVAYDETNDVYLFVWHRTYSSTNRAIFGQRFTSGGTPVGPLISITSTNQNYHSAAVANVNAADRFLVSYTDSFLGGSSDGVLLRAVDADDGLVSPSVSVTPGAAIYATSDVGGNGDPASPYGFVVLPTFDAGIRARRVNAATSGAPTLDPLVSVSPDPADQAPTISKHGGTNGRYLVAWQRDTGFGHRDVHARLLDVGGALVSAQTPVSAHTVADEANPACATGDGANFAIVYERRASGSGGTGDIACRTASLDVGTGFLAVSAESILAGGITQDQIEPAIDFAGSKYLVAWASGSLLGAGWNVFVRGLDPQSCVPCDPATPLDPSATTTDRFPEIGAQYSGSPTGGDEAVVVWESSADVKAQRLEAILGGGAVVDLGGGCAGGGTAGVNGPVALGNAAFAITLTGAGGPGMLVMSGALANLPCGPCTLVPTLGFVLPGPSSVAMPIPCDLSLLGGAVNVQWIAVSPSTCPLLPLISLSNALSVTVGV